MDGHFSFASCPSGEDVNIPGAFSGVRKEQQCKECIAMQPECAIRRSNAHTRSYIRILIYLSIARFKPGSALEDHTRAMYLTWHPRGDSLCPSRESRNLGRPYFTEPSYEICRFSFTPNSFSRSNHRYRKIIAHCRNGSIKHRSGETLNTRMRFIAR